MKSPLPFAATLGNAPSMNYLPGLAMTPPPQHASLRRRDFVARKPRPSLSNSPLVVQRSAANVTGLAIGVVLIDHHARQLQDFGKLNEPTAELLGQLVNQSDEVVEKMADHFSGADADSVNALADIVGQAVELLLQLRVSQIKEGLLFLNILAKSNIK